jgi:hypothetical protein
MFSKTDEEYLIRKLSRNEAMLFLGAGFSMEAVNINNENLPSGRQLSEKIWDFIKLDGAYDGTPLQTLFELLLSKPIKKAELAAFLRGIFTIKDFPPNYRNLSIPFWYKIYTTNIDNLIESIYRKHGHQQIDVLKYPNDDFRDRDHSLAKLQAIFLNGKLPCEASELIFSRKQFSRAAIEHQPLYNQFVHDYCTTTTVFVGTAMDEPVFEQYISARERRKQGISENRPKCFLIDPFISQVKAELLREQYNIEPIKADTRTFLTWLESIANRLPSKLDVLKVVLPSLSSIITDYANANQYRSALGEFSNCLSKVPKFASLPRKTKNYLLGTSPTWSDIANNLDAPRKITDRIIAELEASFESDHKVNLVALLGSAGSGKSTSLKRIAFQLTQIGRTVFFSYSEYFPRIDALIESISFFGERVYLIFDNAELILHPISKALEKLSGLKFPPVIILGSRTNVFDRINRNLDESISIHEYKMPNLDRDEIVSLIHILDDNNLLGALKGLSTEGRIKDLETRARKQILVAMREATKGQSFDEIIRSEFEEIDPLEARILCLCTAITTEVGFTISKQDFVAFSKEMPANALHYLERNLIDVVVKAGHKKDKLLLRHRTIAGYIVDNCCSAEMLKDAYIRVLSALASELNFSSSNNRKFTLYKEIINHYNIYKRFKREIKFAREVYDTLVDYFKDDYHFWLQYGSLELEGIGGNLQLAENYLNQAESLMPKSIFVLNAVANMYYRKGTISTHLSDAIRYKEMADEIINELLLNNRYQDPHTYHISCSGKYAWTIKWVKNRDILKKDLEELSKEINRANLLFAHNKRLQWLRDAIGRAFMLAGVNDDVEYPDISIGYEAE